MSASLTSLRVLLVLVGAALGALVVSITISVGQRVGLESSLNDITASGAPQQTVSALWAVRDYLAAILNVLAVATGILVFLAAIALANAMKPSARATAPSSLDAASTPPRAE